MRPHRRVYCLHLVLIKIRRRRCSVSDLKQLKATTNNAVEAYHKILKHCLRLTAGRIDKLVHDLLGGVAERCAQLKTFKNRFGCAILRWPLFAWITGVRTITKTPF